MGEEGIRGGVEREVRSFMADGNYGMMFLSPNMSAFLYSPAPNQSSAGEREGERRDGG